MPIICSLLAEIKKKTYPQNCFLNVDVPTDVVNHKVFLGQALASHLNFYEKVLTSLCLWLFYIYTYNTDQLGFLSNCYGHIPLILLFPDERWYKYVVILRGPICLTLCLVLVKIRSISNVCMLILNRVID